MSNITTVEASGFIPQIWLNVALGRLKNYLTIQRTVLRDTDIDTNEKFTVGSTLHLPKRGALVVNDKTENAQYTPQNPQSSTVDLVLNHHKEVTFTIESRALSEVNQNIIQGYVEDAAIAIAEQIDTDLFTMYTAAPAANTYSATGTNSLIAEADIIKARGLLVSNKTPAAMRKFGILASQNVNAIYQIDRLVRFDALGISNDIPDAMVGEPIRTMDGSIGKLYNFELCESQLAPFVAGTPNIYKNLFYAQDAFLFASRPLENPDSNLGVQATVITDPDSGIAMRLLHSYQHLLGAHAITLDVLYGFTEMRPEHIVLVNSN